MRTAIQASAEVCTAIQASAEVRTAIQASAEVRTAIQASAEVRTATQASAEVRTAIQASAEERLDDDNDGMDAGKCKALDIVSVMAWAGRDKLLENRALSSPQVAAHFLLFALSSL
nr:hypothetical protein BgiMline_011039 [Biomphalaria glabrata]